MDWSLSTKCLSFSLSTLITIASTHSGRRRWQGSVSLDWIWRQTAAVTYFSDCMFLNGGGHSSDTDLSDKHSNLSSSSGVWCDADTCKKPPCNLRELAEDNADSAQSLRYAHFWDRYKISLSDNSRFERCRHGLVHRCPSLRTDNDKKNGGKIDRQVTIYEWVVCWEISFDTVCGRSWSRFFQRKQIEY